MATRVTAPAWMKIADKPTVPAKQKAVPSQVNGVPNPDTEKGRIELIKEFLLTERDMLMRARLIDNVTQKALNAPNRHEFKDALKVLVDHIANMKNKTIQIAADDLLKTVTNYEKSQGRKFTINEFLTGKEDDEIELIEDEAS